MSVAAVSPPVATGIFGVVFCGDVRLFFRPLVSAETLFVSALICCFCWVSFSWFCFSETLPVFFVPVFLGPVDPLTRSAFADSRVLCRRSANDAANWCRDIVDSRFWKSAEENRTLSAFSMSPHVYSPLITELRRACA